jgi:hypothetical protein
MNKSPRRGKESKTKEMRVNKIQRRITVYRQEIEAVETFSCLGSIVTKKGGADEDTKNGTKRQMGPLFKYDPDR